MSGLVDDEEGVLVNMGASVGEGFYGDEGEDFRNRLLELSEEQGLLPGDLDHEFMLVRMKTFDDSLKIEQVRITPSNYTSQFLDFSILFIFGYEFIYPF